MLSFINFNNTEIKKLNDRILKLEKKLKIKQSKLNENEKRLFQEELKTRKEKINTYNAAFKAWGLDNYGKKENQTIFKKLNYKK